MTASLNYTLLVGDVLARLRELPDESVDCVVTSPPYWGLRDYGVDGQIGLEVTPQEFIGKMVEVFREIRRVLKKSGTCWINMGDTYSASGAAGNREGKQGSDAGSHDKPGRSAGVSGVKKKCLFAIPWKLAIALDEDGWYLRRDIIWSKPNPMPESAKDRPSTTHEYIFLLTKSERYWYDGDAIREPSTGARHDIAGWASGPGSHSAVDHAKPKAETASKKFGGPNSGVRVKHVPNCSQPSETPTGSEPGSFTRNARSVWNIPTQGYKGAHFATFPTEIPTRCILAGCPPGGVVLDPFAGSGTTGAVAIELGRFPILIELNPEYAKMIEKRLREAQPALEVV